MMELFAASLILTLISFSGFAVLVVRRFRLERAGLKIAEAEKHARRYYLDRVRNNDPADLEENVGLESRSRAVAQLSGLLRGEDRARLLKAAESDGIFGTPI